MIFNNVFTNEPEKRMGPFYAFTILNEGVKAKIKHFELLEVISYGEHATIWKVKQKDEFRDQSRPEYLALKIIKEPFNINQLYEAQVHQESQECPGVVKYYDHFYNEEDHLSILMEYCINNLKDYVKDLKENKMQLMQEFF